MSGILALLTYLGYPICKQYPERSFFYGTYQMPVEARDTGIFVGFILTMMLVIYLKRRLEFSRDSLPVLVISGLLSVPLLVDVATSYTGLRTTTNEIRLATGLLFGTGTGMLLTGWFQSISTPSLRPIRTKDMAGLLLVIPLHPLILYGSGTLPGFVMFSLLAVAGYLLFLYISLAIMFHESDLRPFRGRWGTISGTTIVALAETGLLTLLGLAHLAGALLL